MQPATRSRLSATAYVFAWAASLLDQLASLPAIGRAGGLAILVFLVLEFPRQRRYAQILFLALSAIGLAGVANAADPATLFLDAWRRGAAYAAFFFALSSLRDAAETSRLVRRCGHHLVAQPPGRRYAALTGGGHLFGIILSYGAVDLLDAMVMRANTLRAAGGSEQVQALRARRMLMAVFRGFAVMNCWSPLNLMTAVVSTAFPAAPMRLLLPLAFLGSLGMAVIGWAEDRLSSARGATATGARPGTEETWTIHLRIVALVASVMVLAELGSILLRITVVTAVTLIVPIVGLCWASVQARRFIARAPQPRLAAPRLAAVITRRGLGFFHRVPHFRGEATVLAGSGFMGVAAGSILHGAGVAPLLAHLPPVLIPLLVPVLLIATGQLGLNPVAVVALLGAALPNPSAFGVSPGAIAFACMLGWGLAVNMTPMSASAITTARWAGVSPWTITTRWNGKFAVGALLLSWAAIGAMFMLS